MHMVFDKYKRKYVIARIYLPPAASASPPAADSRSSSTFGGGSGFCIVSSAFPIFHRHLSALAAAAASALVLSVHAPPSLHAPSHRIPVQYDHSWAASQRGGEK